MNAFTDKHNNTDDAQSSGYVALVTTILTFMVSLTVIGGFTFFVYQETRINRAFTKSIEAKYIAEGGVEDMVYRIFSGKQYLASETLAVGDGAAMMTVVTSGDEKTIRSEGVRDNLHQNMETKVTVAVNGASFFYGLQAGQGGFDLKNGAMVIGNVYANGNIIGQSGAPGASITGDVVVAGGLNATPSIEWTTHDADQLFATVSGNRDIAQSFTANANDKLTKVAVYLGKVGSPTNNIDVYITHDNSGSPATSDIAHAIISYTSVGVMPSWIEVTFASPPTLANGSKYWIVLDYNASSATNHWNWRKDSTNGYAGNTAKYKSNWSSGGPWTNVNGDLAFRVWLGGTVTRIEDIAVGSSPCGGVNPPCATARANVFINVDVNGFACPNPDCITDNPPQASLPVSDGLIQDWKNDAETGGTTVGDVIVNGSQTIGPQKITGKLTVSNGSTLIISGTLWVVGDIVFDNNSMIQLSPSYDTFSDVIMSDAKINVKNGATVSGSGKSASFTMLLATKDAPGEEVITIDNNSQGVIYYAGKAWIKFSNNANAKEATAYGIRLDNNAVITYDSGLANLYFSSGPSGGYKIDSWKRVE